MIRSLVTGVAGALAALAVCLPALAQEAPPAPAPERAQPEEIIITATKREANIQEVPIAVSAFQADELEARGIAEIEDLEQVSPSLLVNTSNTSSAGGTMRIRGIGTTGNNPGLEAAVGMFVDGVYRSRSGQGLTDLLDIERVEVLRGPQGTLFGKNTSAGAVNVITKRPNLSEAEGWVAGELGNFDHKKLSASYSVPIIEEVLAFRGSAIWTDRDGYYEDAHSDKAWGDRDRYTLRGQLLWAPTDIFDARIIAEWTERDESCCPAQVFVAGPSSNRSTGGGNGADELAALLGLGRDIPDISNPITNPTGCVGVPPTGNCVGFYPFFQVPRNQLKQRKVGVNTDPFEKIFEWGVSLELNLDLDWSRVTSITAYRRFNARYAQDLDFTSADILNPQNGAEDDFKNFSEELRISGTAFDHLDWLGGIYVYTEDISVRERLEFGSQAGEFFFGLTGPLPPTTPGVDPLPQDLVPQGAGYSALWKTDTTGFAIFTNNTWRGLLLENLDLTVGARWSRDEKDAKGDLNDAPLAVRNGRITNNYVAGQPVPLGTNDPISTNPAVVGGWCEDVTGSLYTHPTLGDVPAFASVRQTLRSLCDNGSWTNGAVEKEWTYTASLAYHWTEGLTTYFTYSRGYKTGGFNLDQESVDINTNAAGLVTAGCALCDPDPNGVITGINDESRFKPEFADSYEVGIKSEFFDGRLRTNIAGFFTKFDDFQLNTFNGLGFTVSNVDEVEAKGFEFESFINPVDGVTITLGTTYSDVTYGDNVDLCFPQNLPDGSLNGCVSAGGVDTGPGAPFAADFIVDGFRITNAPLWTSTISFQGEHTLPNTEWLGTFSTNATYRGKHNTGSNLFPLKVEKGLWFLNMEIGVVSPDRDWEFSIWATNLTNTYENQIVFDSVFQTGGLSTFFNPPRMWGATLRYNFE